MGLPARVLCAMTPALLGVALVASACGGRDTYTFSADDRSKPRSTVARAPTQAQEPAPPAARPAWPHAKVLRRIAGEVLRIDGRRVRVDRATVTCGGEGPGLRRGHERVWERFTCIQPSFGAGGAVGPDIVFRVEPTGPQSFRIVDQRFTRY
jgi:hypothetical protein